eukprot:6344796-Amphidinium_carterae.1
MLRSHSVYYASMRRGSALSCSVIRPPFSYRATDESVRHRPLFFTAAKSLPPYSMSWEAPPCRSW